MTHMLKTAEFQDFRLSDGDDIDLDDYHLAKKTNAADRRDMARMGKSQEMRVRGGIVVTRLRELLLTF